MECLPPEGHFARQSDGLPPSGSGFNPIDTQYFISSLSTLKILSNSSFFF